MLIRVAKQIIESHLQYKFKVNNQIERIIEEEHYIKVNLAFRIKFISNRLINLMNKKKMYFNKFSINFKSLKI